MTSPSRFDELVALDPDLVRCPFGVYDVLRQDEPVHLDARLNAYVVSRYDDVQAVLRDPGTFSSEFASGPSSVTGLARRLVEDPTTADDLRRQAQRRLDLSTSPVLLMSDPPLHKRQRLLVAAGFTPRRIRLMEDDVAQLAHELIDAFVGDGKVELVEQFSIHLPMTVIARVLGVPASKMRTFKRWSNAFTAGVGALEQSPEALAEMFSAVDEFYDYFTEQVEQRRVEPRDDLLSDLVAARLDGEEPLTLDEILNMLVQFLVAGNETTTNLLTTLVRMLVEDPATQREVREDPELLPVLVEEALRLEAPIQGMFRTTTVDTELAGTTIPVGSTVYLLYASANRDAAAWPQPDGLCLDDTARSKHLAFGGGEHFCLGANIARLEARLGVQALLDRLDDLALVHPDAPPTYHRSFVIRGIADLPLTFRAR